MVAESPSPAQNGAESNPAPLPRRHEIDALRSIALLLLIAYHAFCAFQPFAAAIQFIEFSEHLGSAWFIGELLNPWRVPVLFLISGITSGYLLQNRRVGKLVKARLLRLVPPLVVTLFLIAPISPALFARSTGESLAYAAQPGHLWFVWNLVVYFVFGAPFFVLLKSHPENLLVALCRWFAPWGWFVVLPVALTLPTWLLEPHITPDIFGTHFWRFWYGFACFLSGVFLVSLRDEFWQGIRRACHVALLAGLALYLRRMFDLQLEERLHELFLRTMESTYGMLAFLGYGARLLDRSFKLVGSLNRGVFAVYIVHLPIQQAIALYLFPVGLNAWLTFALLLVGTLASSVAFYALALQPLPWLHPLFGIPSASPRPSGLALATAAAPANVSWPVRVARFMILYVATPIIVIVTTVFLVGTLIG